MKQHNKRESSVPSTGKQGTTGVGSCRQGSSMPGQPAARGHQQRGIACSPVPASLGVGQLWPQLQRLYPRHCPLVQAPCQPAALRRRCPPAIQGAAPAWGSGREPSPRLLRGAPPPPPTGTQLPLPAGCPHVLQSRAPAGPPRASPPLRPPSAPAWPRRSSGGPGPPGCASSDSVSRGADASAQDLQNVSRAHDPSWERQRKQTQVCADAGSGCS